MLNRGVFHPQTNSSLTESFPRELESPIEDLPETLGAAQFWALTKVSHRSQGYGMRCSRIFACGNSWRKLWYQISILKVSGCFCVTPASSHRSWHLAVWEERWMRKDEWGECGRHKVCLQLLMQWAEAREPSPHRDSNRRQILYDCAVGSS